MTPIRHDPIFPLPAIPCDHLSVASKLLLRSLIYSSPGQESCRWRPYYKTYVMHCAFCAEAPGSRPWPSSPSDSRSEPLPPCSASSMECCCARFLIPNRTASWPSSRSIPKARGPVLPIPTSTSLEIKVTASKRLQSTQTASPRFQVAPSPLARPSPASLPAS